MGEFDNVEDLKKHEIALALEKEKAALSLVNELHLILLKTVAEYGQIAIRTVIVSNGLAVTAILTFLGSKAEVDKIAKTEWLAAASLVAAIGVALGFGASVLAYLNQSAQLKDLVVNGAYEPGTKWQRKFAVWLVFLGMGTFLMTVILAATAYIAASRVSSVKSEAARKAARVSTCVLQYPKQSATT